jgi:hypothetical protein
MLGERCEWKRRKRATGFKHPNRTQSIDRYGAGSKQSRQVDHLEGGPLERLVKRRKGSLRVFVFETVPMRE